MDSAIETRDVLSKVDGVTRVHPNGLNSTALVFVKDPKKTTVEALEKALEGTQKLRLRKLKQTMKKPPTS